MNLDEIWTILLDFIATVIIPVWNDLIQYIPLLLLLLLIATGAWLAWYWRRNSAINRPRVPRPMPSGRKPEGIHLPGPSLWPFVAPIGLLFMVFSLALGIGSSLLTLALFAAGLLIGVVGVLGWLVDAGREYREVETGGHGHGHAQLTAQATAAPPPWSLEPPAGVHLPGPSPWPFLAPVGLFFIVAGFIFGPVLIVAGLIMGAIAAIGWLRDADRELVDVEAHGHATPATRDPERVWPSALVPIYTGVAALALAITLLPWALTLLPSGAADDVAGPPPVEMPFVSASTVTEFEITEIATFADRPFQLEFENKQAGVPHNVAIYESAAQETELFLGQIFDGPDTRIYEVGPLAAGEYFYVCSVHPPMIGTLYVRS